MALRFFWRCGGTTLDATHDYTNADNTSIAVGTPSIGAGGIGSSNAIIKPASTQAGYGFAASGLVNSTVDGATHPSDLVFSSALSFKCSGTLSGSDFQGTDEI